MKAGVESVENRFVRKIENAFSARAFGKHEGHSDPKGAVLQSRCWASAPESREYRVCRVFETQPLLLQTFFRSSTRVPLRQRRHHGRPLQGGITGRTHSASPETNKQTEVLESRTFGSATDTDILEYEIRQEVIHEICNQLANSAAA